MTISRQAPPSSGLFFYNFRDIMELLDIPARQQNIVGLIPLGARAEFSVRALFEPETREMGLAEGIEVLDAAVDEDPGIRVVGFVAAGGADGQYHRAWNLELEAGRQVAERFTGTRGDRDLVDKEGNLRIGGDRQFVGRRRSKIPQGEAHPWRLTV